MAVQPRPYELKWQLGDDDNRKSYHKLHASRLSLITVVEGFADDNVARLQAVSDCTVLRYSVALPDYEDTPTFAAGADVEVVGVLEFLNADGTISEVTIPGLKESCVATNGQDLNLANPAIAALVARILTGVPDMTDERGASFFALIRGYKQRRRSQKERRTRKG